MDGPISASGTTITRRVSGPRSYRCICGVDTIWAISFAPGNEGAGSSAYRVPTRPSHRKRAGVDEILKSECARANSIGQSTGRSYDIDSRMLAPEVWNMYSPTMTYRCSISLYSSSDRVYFGASSSDVLTY